MKLSHIFIPSDQATPHQGRVVFLRENSDDPRPTTAKYYVMPAGDTIEQLPQFTSEGHPGYQYVFVPLGIIIYDLKNFEERPAYEISDLLNAFVNEAQRDFSEIWKRICQSAKKETFKYLNQID